MRSAQTLLTATLILQAALLQASALGQLESAAGRSASSVAVPLPSQPDVSDHTASEGPWILHCDCSACPSAWYPESHPTKGPYASEADCLSDLNAAKYRAGASSCEVYYCQQSGGGSSGGSAGAAAVKSGVQEAVQAAQAAVSRQSQDRGTDLLAADAQTAGADGARYGIGRRKRKPPPPTPGNGGGTVKLLRKAEDNGSPIVAKPYINCATWRAEAERLRSGLAKQQETLDKGWRMLEAAEAGSQQASEQAQEKAKELALGALIDTGKDIAAKAHRLEKGILKASEAAGLSREERAMGLRLARQMAKTHEQAQTLTERVKLGDKFIEAGGGQAWMRGALDGLQASYQAAMADPELREEILNFAGEGIAELGGPGTAFAYKVLKADIDFTALAVSKGLDDKEAAAHRKSLKTLDEQLKRSQGRIRFLQQEGEAQCKKN